MADFLQIQRGATKVFCDTKATIAKTKNPTFHSRTKHIDIRYHFIRKLITDEEVTLSYCNTNSQVVDILTKLFPRAKHEVFKFQMGVTSFEASGSVESASKS